jgi:CheY-like chemotaxis protein
MQVSKGQTLHRRVLIIEDNADLAESLRLLLEHYGCLVKTAYCGLEGLRSAIEWRPDVIVIDIALPGMSGYEVARALRSTLTYRATLIAQTAYGLPEDRRKAFDSGFDVHLIKPAEPDCLFRHVADAKTFAC